MKKILKGLLGLCLIVPLISGCSSEKDATKLVNESIKEMQNVKSMSGDFTMKFKVSMKMDKSDKMTVDVNAKGDYEFMKDPMAMHLNLDMNMSTFGQKQKQAVEMYYLMDDSKMQMYANSDDTVWLSTTNEIDKSYKDSIKMPKGFDKKLIKALEPKSIKTEKKNGFDTEKVRMSINKKAIKNILDVVSKMEGANKDQMVPEAVISELDKLDEKISLDFFMNIDKKTKRIAAYEMSLSKEATTEIEKLINKQMGKELSGAKISIDDLSFTFNIKKYDKVKEVVVPQEVIETAIDTSAAISAPGTGGEVVEPETEENVATDPEDNVVEGNLATQTHVWESMNFKLDNKEFTVNKFTAQDIADLGYKPESDKLSDKVKKGEFKMVFMLKGNSSLGLALSNEGKKTAKIKDLPVTSISNYGDAKLTIDGNIKVGSTKEEVIAAFGEPNTTYTSEGYISLDYSTEDYSKALTISIADGVVDSIALSMY